MRTCVLSSLTWGNRINTFLQLVSQQGCVVSCSLVVRITTHVRDLSRNNSFVENAQQNVAKMSSNLNFSLNPDWYTTQLKIAQVVTGLLAEQCCSNTVIMAEQRCSTNNVVHYCFNNVVQRTMLFNEQCCSLLFQQCRSTCSTNNVHYCFNNVVHYCFNNVVQHWWSNNGCSRLLKQGKTILLEQACSLSLSTLLTRCNSIDGWTMM